MIVSDPLASRRSMAENATRVAFSACISEVVSLIEVEFEFERETKNTVRLAEVEGDEAPAVGSLYLRKHTYKKLGSPRRLKVKIEAGD